MIGTKSKGYGFVKFENKTDCLGALDDMAEATLETRVLVVKRAYEEKDDKPVVKETGQSMS